MLKLYGGAFSRASIVRWYLEELGTPYEYVTLDLKAGEHQQPDFLEVNPIGKVPAIVDGGFKLWESGAILLYLTEKYSKPLSLEQRSTLNQWISYANATMGPEVFTESTRERALPRHMTMLNQLFERQSYVVGNEFTVADVAVASLIGYIPMMLKLDLSAYSHVTAYMEQLRERPAFQKTIGSRK